MSKQSGLSQVSAQCDRFRGNNDYLFRELSLARPEIEELQSCVRDLERDPPRLPPLAVLLTQACDACVTYSDLPKGRSSSGNMWGLCMADRRTESRLHPIRLLTNPIKLPISPIRLCRAAIML
ncbi:hypothetical protein PI124_g5463 [Phytophthora idaei]|nr:hypothetical protein PI126_g18120 [Phytophthora idaei]KAG3249858.1 hypothetical protein PI124_g5463 [Phytophthora idaei]